MTHHAQDNLNRYSEMIGTQKVKMLMSGIKKVSNFTDSTAVIVEINPIKNPYRNDWEPNDILCAIVREGDVVTVMLSRKNQVSKKHFRTNRIVLVH